MRELSTATAFPGGTRPQRPTTILQFGAGNFLRAFVDQMVHQANVAGVLDAGIAVVHTRPRRPGAPDPLAQQDGLFHVLLEGVRDGEPVRETTVVDAVTTVVRAHEDFAAYRDLYLSPDLKVVVSNTTEAGIVWADGEDLAAQPPTSFPAKITALLHDRFEAFGGDPSKGLRIVCCELIEDNATTLRELVLRHAADAGLSAGFTAWVTTACSFHDSLVDRIVPGYPEAEAGELQAALGFRDEALVKGELFALWAVADEHGLLRDVLPLDRAGLPVVFLDDVRPFRDKKVRILNGLHTAMTQVGLLLGCESVREAVAHPAVAAYLDRLLRAEILPSIPDHDGGPEARAELEAFAARITERFANPFLHHRLADISLNSLSKWQARNLPVVLDSWAAGRPADASVLAFAALAVLASGQGPDAATVSASGWQPRDDAAPLAVLRDTFDADDVEGWLRRVIEAAGFFADAAPSPDTDADTAAHLTTRLAAEAAVHAHTLLRDGTPIALKELTR